jgi:serine/threonine protein phosphatase PrpC
VTKLSIKTVGLTDQGKVRNNNEDAVWVDEDLGLMIVADGMGGHKAGEVASGLAVTTIRNNFKQLLETHSNGEITDKHLSVETNSLGFCLRMANKMIFDAAELYPQDSGMGTACTAGVIKENRLSLAHVGDTRCYLIRRGELDQLTEDHSLVAEQIKYGVISKDDEAARINQNILTRSLGTEPEVRVDLEEHPLFPGDVLLLCSDGLGKELTNAQVLQTAMETPEPEKLARRLIEMANAAGGRDNITVAVCRVDKAGFGEWFKSLFKLLKGKKLEAARQARGFSMEVILDA